MSDYFNTSKSLLQEITSFKLNGIKLLVKRDDLIHEFVSGNKWRKLKYSVLQAQSKGKKGILTFGGAFSNHLLATASACNLLNLKSIGMVRGNELNSNSNKTLQNCKALGMELIFLDRETYQLRNDYDYLNEIKNEYNDYFIVPEGGANFYGIVGCQEIWSEINEEINHVFVAQGTCTTSCGLLIGLPEKTTLHVVPALKGFDSFSEMRKLLKNTLFEEDLIEDLLQKVEVHLDFHFGGYGKYTKQLLDFIEEIQTKHELPLDFVYTGKAYFCLLEELKKEKYKNQTVLFLHTGGLQGNLEKT
ncbi:MAG: pyridoxal-phosphate dependent enzyme [Bacteroidota bacterium]